MMWVSIPASLTWFIWGGRLSLVLLSHFTDLQLQTLLRRENVTVQHLCQIREKPFRSIKSRLIIKSTTHSPPTWKVLVACVLGNQLSFSWNNCITSCRRCSNSFRCPFSLCSPPACPFSVALIGPPPADRSDDGNGVFGVRGDFSQDTSIVFSAMNRGIKVSH